MNTLTVREYQPINIGKDFSLDPPAITERQARQLEKLSDGMKCKLFTWKLRSIVPQQYVGIISFGKISLEILPKIEKSDNVEIRHNLIHMLSVCRKLEIHESELARLAKKRMDLLEMFIRIFCNKLFAQVHKGLIRRYQTLEENIHVLRGSFLIPEQLRCNACKKERFFCRYDEFNDDNPYNRVLKSALIMLRHITRSEENRQLIQKLIPVFEDVATVDAIPEDVDKLAFDRTIRRYEPLFHMARIILSSCTPDVSSGTHVFFALLFDMNRLFEEYIGRMVQKVFIGKDPIVCLQGPHKFLARDHFVDGKLHFRLKPDIVMLLGDRTEKIIDTKWKMLSQDEKYIKISPADMYQMYVYAHQYCCPEITLLYPHYSSLGLPGILKRFKLEKETAEEIFINVATISLADVRKEVIQSQLRAILK